jgi:hypothetical protein
MRPIKVAYMMFLMILTGCMASGPLFVKPDLPTKDYARIVIYREEGLGGAAWPHPYYVDKTLVAKLRVGGYTTFLVSPGFRSVHYGATPDFEGFLIKLDLRGGQTYYFKEGRNIDFDAPANSVDHFVLIQEEDALPEIKSYKFQNPIVEIFSGSDNQIEKPVTAGL